ncbi:MAG: hypothetical protein EZS28_010095 [Streblomastix strix]|uniref:Uncharacterized protein n=1 Tax=Streblomastix strix TaxID=222440 RepID=A0A5J4WH86_9EUKA|nr:MAG: hypothetical protein EZS28_010095 [Streblomastix strix]
MSPRQSVPIIPAITEVDSTFENEIEKWQDQVSIQSICYKRRSSAFEEIIVPYPQICRQLLEIVSEDEHMIKESAHFILSQHQLIKIIAYTFYVVENQVVLNAEDEGFCGKYMNDDTRTLSDITINNVNILTLDIDKVNLLRDSYKLCLQEVRKITSIFDLGDISSKLMSAANLNLYDDFLIHDEILYGNVRHNVIEANEIFDTIADKSDTYSKIKSDEKQDLKLNIADQIDVYTKIETDTKLDEKADKSELIDAYSKTETDDKLNLKADKTDTVDSYSKTEDEAFLLLKADKTDLTKYIDLISAQTISGQKQFGTINVSSISQLSKNDASILLAGGGDIQVSSLVTQSQLQKIRDIATDQSKTYVHSTQKELNGYMSIQDNVAKLVIGDNSNIINKEITECDQCLSLVQTERIATEQ